MSEGHGYPLVFYNESKHNILEGLVSRQGQQQSLFPHKINSHDTTNSGNDTNKNTTRGRQIGEEEERKRQARSQGKEEDEKEKIWSWDKSEVVMENRN